MSILYLFSEYYPYGDESMSEHAFIENEIPYLKDKFAKIVVVPSYLTDHGVSSHFLFDFDLSLAKLLKKSSSLKILCCALMNKYTYLEIISKPLAIIKIHHLKRLIYHTGTAHLAKKWLDSKIKRGLDPFDTLFYTFWCNAITLGISSINDIKVVSRAHGHDIFQTNNRYIPCYPFVLKKLAKMYIASENSAFYLKERYPNFSKKIETCYLGVRAAVNRSSYSNDGIVRVVSCSYLIKRKRVDLIIEGLNFYIKKYKRKVLWIHFGDGPEFEKINNLASAKKVKDFNYKLMGKINNKKLLEYYLHEPVDIFILCSEEEGGVPVVLQEAQTYGIPIIGTKIGGIPEIINENVGVLLSATPSSEEIADAINYIISNKSRYIKMREHSAQNWKKNFNAKSNYQQFAVDLKFILVNN